MRHFGHDLANNPACSLFECNLDGVEYLGYALDQPDALRLSRLAHGGGHVRNPVARPVSPNDPRVKAEMAGRATASAGAPAPVPAPIPTPASPETLAAVGDAVTVLATQTVSEAGARVNEPLPGVDAKEEERLEGQAAVRGGAPEGAPMSDAITGEGDESGKKVPSKADVARETSRAASDRAAEKAGASQPTTAADVGRSEASAIRSYLRTHPDARNRDVVSALKRDGKNVDSSQVSAIKKADAAKASR